MLFYKLKLMGNFDFDEKTYPFYVINCVLVHITNLTLCVFTLKRTL